MIKLLNIFDDYEEKTDRYRIEITKLKKAHEEKDKKISDLSKRNQLLAQELENTKIELQKIKDKKNE